MGCQDTIKILTHFVSGSLSTRTFINNTPCLTCFCSATSPTVEDRVWNISFQMDVIDFNIPLIILKLSVLITHTFWYFLPLAILSNKSDKCNRLWHPQIRCSAYTVGRTIFSVVGSGMGQSYALRSPVTLSCCPQKEKSFICLVAVGHSSLLHSNTTRILNLLFKWQLPSAMSKLYSIYLSPMQYISSGLCQPLALIVSIWLLIFYYK